MVSRASFSYDVGMPPVTRFFAARQRWRGLTVAFITGAAALIIAILVARPRTPPPPIQAPAPVPRRDAAVPMRPQPLTTAFENTRAGVTYVGSQACVSCHTKRHQTFRHTGMGRSMAPIDLSQEPPDASFDHPLSHRRFQIRRHKGQLWHREFLITEHNDAALLQEFPVKYVMGSGHFSRSYVAEIDGFLVESPITFYAATKNWGVSPGYDLPDPIGFERPVKEECVSCHSGRLQMIEKSVHRMNIIEPAIGCERCHGPGSLHIAVHKAAPKTKPGIIPDAIDTTIVNPAHLSRELAEAVCQQCHLQTGSLAYARGKGADSFRPGLPLQASRQDYTRDGPGTAMTVVGHVEQMHLSRCYQASKTFTCTTCHTPHAEPTVQTKVAHYKTVCLGCHKPQDCTVDPNRRASASPQNNCVQCHMPQSPTDIPHLAFTHHRVAIHTEDQKPAVAHPGPDTLKPFLDLSGLDDAERARSLALAYLDRANNENDPAQREHYLREALRRLSGLPAANPPDAPVAAAIAIIQVQLRGPNYEASARTALADPQIAGLARADALFAVAAALFAQRRFTDCIQTLAILNRSRRESRYWLMLAESEKALGNQAGMKVAIQKATAINPALLHVGEK